MKGGGVVRAAGGAALEKNAAFVGLACGLEPALPIVYGSDEVPGRWP